MYLTLLLLENLKKNKGRVVTLSSMAHSMCQKMDLENINGPCTMHSRYYLYGRAKLANMLFAKELQRRYGDSDIVSYSVHPGAVMTELMRHISTINSPTLWIQPLFMKTAWEGAQTTLFAAPCDPKEVQPGSYLSDCAVKIPTLPTAHDFELQKRLWEVSEKALGL
jgi:retinol dehydrogenase-12